MKKDFQSLIHKSFIIIFSFFILFTSAISYALPFNIVPKVGTTLPSSVTKGGTVTAYYTVINNTSTARNGNYVKWLPPNVTQATSGTYGDTCGAVFYLAPQGQSGDSCTLQLAISGAVYANDSNPKKHLFVCFPGGLTCAGTNSPLNVQVAAGSTLTSITIAPSSLAATNPNTDINVSVGNNATKQLTATGHYADNTTADITAFVNWNSSSTGIATVGTGGTNNGLATANTTRGQTTISATQGGVEASITLSVVPFAYAIEINNGSGKTYWCSFNGSNEIETCTQTTFSFSHPWGIGANPAAANLYISDTGGGINAGVYVCPVSTTGDILAACPTTNYDNTIFGSEPPAYIAVNPIGTIAYLTDANGPGLVGYCKIKASDGTFSSCASLCNSSYCGGTGIVISPDNQWAYINGFDTTSSDGVIYACPIINSGPNAGTFGSCSLIYTTPTTDHLWGLAINSAGDTLYATDAPVTSSSINIYTCPIITPGQPVSCTLTPQILNIGNSTSSIALNPAANYAYTVGSQTGNNSFCSAPVSSLGTCTRPSSPVSFTQLQGIATF